MHLRGVGKGTLVSDPIHLLGPGQSQVVSAWQVSSPRITTERLHFLLGTAWPLPGQETLAAGL